MDSQISGVHIISCILPDLWEFLCKEWQFVEMCSIPQTVSKIVIGKGSLMRVSFSYFNYFRICSFHETHRCQIFLP